MNQATEFVRSVRVEPSLIEEGRDFSLHPGDRVLHAFLRDITNHHGNFQATEDLEGKLAGHQSASDHTHFGDGLGVFSIRCPGGYLRSFLSQHEGIDAGPELVSGDQLGKDVVFRCEPLSLGG